MVSLIFRNCSAKMFVLVKYSGICDTKVYSAMASFESLQFFILISNYSEGAIRKMPDVHNV